MKLRYLVLSSFLLVSCSASKNAGKSPADQLAAMNNAKIEGIQLGTSNAYSNLSKQSQAEHVKTTENLNTLYQDLLSLKETIKHFHWTTDRRIKAILEHLKLKDPAVVK